MSSVAIVTDVYEQRSGIPQRLEELGATVGSAQLEAGDYAFANALVERKSVLDLHLSVTTGKFWPQIGKLRSAGPTPFLLVEGDHLDAGPLRPASVRGICVAVIELGIRLIRTESREDSALWIYRLAVRRSVRWRRDKPGYAQRRKPPSGDQTAEAMLAAVPGISAQGAKALLRHFGSVANVLAADIEAWQAVPGIGPERAKAIEATLNKRPTS